MVIGCHGPKEYEVVLKQLQLILNNSLNYRTLAGVKVISCFYLFTFSLMHMRGRTNIVCQPMKR
jgi:hypothetical protein